MGAHRSIFTLFLLLVATATAEERIWTDDQGKKLTGKFVEQVGDQVTIESDRVQHKIPFKRFSLGDQVHIKSLAASTESSSAGESASSPAEPYKKKVVVGDRVWTDNTNRKIKARFVRVHLGNVVLQTSTVLSVPFFNLSEEDQSYVREVLESRGQLDLLPTRPPAPVDVPPPVNPGIPGNGGMPNDFAAEAQRRAAEMREKMEADRAAMQERLEQSRRDAEERSREIAAKMEEDRQRRAQAQEDAKRASEERAQQLAAKQEEDRQKWAQKQADHQANRPPIGGLPTSNFAQYECMKCKRSITASQAQEARCPYCGVFWFSKPSEVYAASAASRGPNSPGTAVAGIVLIVIILMIIAVPIALIAFIVWLIRTLANSSTPHGNPYGNSPNPYVQNQNTNPFGQRNDPFN